jgi:hypothetical protein
VLRRLSESHRLLELLLALLLLRALGLRETHYLHVERMQT